MNVRWDSRVQAWVSDKGRVIAPRGDEDGIDFFFVLSPKDKGAVARYCAGEGYWAFSKLTQEQVYEFREMIKEILAKKWRSKFAKKAQEILQTIKL